MRKNRDIGYGACGENGITQGITAYFKGGKATTETADGMIWITEKRKVLGNKHDYKCDQYNFGVFGPALPERRKNGLSAEGPDHA